MATNDSMRFNSMIGKLEETASDLSNFLEEIEDRNYRDGAYFYSKNETPFEDEFEEQFQGALSNLYKVINKLDYLDRKYIKSLDTSKLESRISRLERMMNSQSVKNEVTDPVATAIYRVADSIKQIVNNLCRTLECSGIINYSDVDMALSICQNSFSNEANDRFSSIFERRNSLG